MVLAELRRQTTIQKAFESPKMIAVKRLIGEETLHKLLCFIIKDFQDSLKLTDPAHGMSAAEIFSAADMLMGTGEYEYGYESVFDILMAFKHFKANPTSVFNKFNDADLRVIMRNYLEVKAEYTEKRNGQAAKDALKKDPLTPAQIKREYELSMSGLETNGDRINKQKTEFDRKNPRNWRSDDEYRAYLASRNWKEGYAVEDVPHEVVDDDPEHQQYLM